MTKIKEIIIDLLLCGIIIISAFWVFKYFNNPLDRVSVCVGYSLCVSSQIIRILIDRYIRNK